MGKRFLTKQRHAMASKFLGTRGCPLWTPRRPLSIDIETPCRTSTLTMFSLNPFSQLRAADLFPKILRYKPLCNVGQQPPCHRCQPPSSTLCEKSFPLFSASAAFHILRCLTIWKITYIQLSRIAEFSHSLLWAQWVC